MEAAFGGISVKEPDNRLSAAAGADRVVQPHGYTQNPPRAFGRVEAPAPNDRWTGDALHGPVVAGRKTFLFAFVDDHGRSLVGYRWGHSEDTVRLEAALRAGLASRGVPKVVDNGSAMVSSQLLRALAVLGIKLTHSKPGQPAGRGKIERMKDRQMLWVRRA